MFITHQVPGILQFTPPACTRPLLCGLRGVGVAAGLALGDVVLEEVRSLVPTDGELRPDPTTRATYDRMFAELPRLYRSQRRMFSRLNR